MGKNIKATGSTIENQNSENVSIYMNDYFPGMALSWYWGFTNTPINGLYILQTNNDDKYRH
jgi:hypothetical protein